MHKLTLSLQPYVSVTANSYGQYGNIPQCVLMLMKMCQTQWCALFLQDVEGRHSLVHLTGQLVNEMKAYTSLVNELLPVCMCAFFTSLHLVTHG